MAVIKGKYPCLRAKELNEMLGALKVNFINGLSITIMVSGHGDEVFPTHSRRVDDIYSNMMKTPWKYLEFEWRMSDDCVLGQFVIKLMISSLTLEHLAIKDIPSGVELKDENMPADDEVGLPKLKTILLPSTNLQFCFKSGLVTNLLARAPNAGLANSLHPRWIQAVPVKRLKAVKNFQIPYLYGDGYAGNEAIRLLDILSASEPELTTLASYRPSFPDADDVNMMGDYFDRLSSIIYSSSVTLREVKLDKFSVALFSYSVMEKFFPVLKNVEKLTFEMYLGLHCGITRFLLRKPLVQMFPAVTTVTFSAKYRNFKDDGDRPDVEQPAVSPWPAVKEVKFENLKLCEHTVGKVRILFPNFYRLEVSFLSSCHAPSFLFRHVWSNLSDLKQLIVRGKLTINFDAEFCGIYPEEAALLRRRDVEYLGAVNIVPPFAPITYMRGKDNYICLWICVIDVFNRNSV